MHHGIVESLIGLVTHVITMFGYGGVFLWMTLESACIPIPSEAIMPFAGKEIASGRFDLNALAFVGAFANLFGSLIAYWVGVAGGRPFVQKYGKYILIRQDDVDIADRWFARHGEATVFWTRMLPIIRTFISLPAGISRMNFPRFCIYTFVGALPWCYLLAWAGMKLGEHWTQVSKYLHKADLAILVVLVVMFALWFYRHTRPEPDPAEAEPETTTAA
ncbi:MAG: DedA family protein [Capsulimonadaceae bacterium]|nr:DedA family protein [Capsulimonadaceae bacterium]